MKKDFKFYTKLFTSTFYLSAFTFGGGYVIVPLMRKQFVNKYKWIDEEEMFDLTAIAQATPGAIAVNAAILIGYRLAGLLGAMITVLGTVLPPLVIISAISVAYTAFRDNVLIHSVLLGMQAGVAAVILDVVVTMINSLQKERKKMPILIFIGVLIAVFVFKLDIFIVILLSGILGAISYQQAAGKNEAEEAE